MLAIIVGIIALAWPKVTILALVILFAIYAFIAAGLQAMRAFSSRKAGPVIGYLLLALIDVAAGVIALAWPGPTALVLVLVIGFWAVVAGIFEIAAGFARGESAGTRTLFILAGLVTVAFGVVPFAHPNIGAFAIALLLLLERAHHDLAAFRYLVLATIGHNAHLPDAVEMFLLGFYYPAFHAIAEA